MPTSSAIDNHESSLLIVPSLSLVSTMMPNTMEPSSANAGSAKYHQWGCISTAMVSPGFRFFDAYGTAEA